MSTLKPTGSILLNEVEDNSEDDNTLFVNKTFVEPQKVLDSRLSKI